MKNIRIQLWLLTSMFGVGFFDGFFSLGLSDDLYVFTGLVIMGTIIWMWVDLNRSK